ncbi:MAG: outer membrane protein assembly factor BamA [Pseudomonadota bacterium]
MLLHSVALAFEAFVVEDIRLKGLKRIEAGTVFNYLPVTVGQRFSQENASSAISALFKTGFFKDVRLEREGNVLIVRVEERPAIFKMTFTGNEEIETEDLIRSLKNIGFAEGRVFNRSVLEKVALELQRQYLDLGRYGVQIKSTVTPLKRNRVAIQIDISEGAVARIHQINFVGNQTVSDEVLLDQMKSSTSGWFSFISGNDQYSRPRLAADLEALRSYYLDRGYINFNIDSRQVSITPDKKEVYITINLTEGDKYTVSNVKLLGKLIVSKAELLDKISIKPGEVFSRKKVIRSQEAIKERIGDEGYYFANINPVPDIDSDKKTVALSFFVEPGKRVYVRRINFKGNTKTRDEVLRREMRQMEGGWISTRDVKRSLTRLERLGYFEEVTVETSRVTDDQVDIDYTVVERPSSNIMASIGYAQTQGIVFNASLTQDNFLGSGKRVGLKFNNSKVNTVYSFSYFNPYTTIDGVSRGFKVFYRTTDAEEANLSRYTTDAYGTTLNYGLPITEYNNITLGAAFDHTTLKTTGESAQEVFDFVDANGDTYNSYRLSASLRYDTRNRALFPDKGMLQSISAEVALPFSDLSYYKLTYRHQWLYPFTKDYIFLFKGQLGFGEAYGDDEDLPFFENFTAGGPRTVRGFRENSLGPSDSKDRSFGGNLKVVGNAELIMPIPFLEKVRAFRFSAFVDVGNVYGGDEDFDTSQLRYSTGLSLIGLTPLGLLSFSYAIPLKSQEDDRLERFQFTIGTTFNW